MSEHWRETTEKDVDWRRIHERRCLAVNNLSVATTPLLRVGTPVARRCASLYAASTYLDAHGCRNSDPARFEAVKAQICGEVDALRFHSVRCCRAILCTRTFAANLHPPFSDGTYYDGKRVTGRFDVILSRETPGSRLTTHAAATPCLLRSSVVLKAARHVSSIGALLNRGIVLLDHYVGVRNGATDGVVMMT